MEESGPKIGWQFAESVPFSPPANLAEQTRAILSYTIFMAQVTLNLPDVLFGFLTASGHGLERGALEAIALEAYREDKISTAQLRQLLGYHTRAQVHAFLKEHGVYLRYDLADLERDRQAGDTIRTQPNR